MAKVPNDGRTPEPSIECLIKRNFRFCTDALSPALKEHGLTLTEWHALTSIGLNRAAIGAELARDLAHDNGATTRLIDTLEVRGLVCRERAKLDRRRVILATTGEGKRVARQARLRVIDCWNDWLSSWDRSDVEQLILLLQRLEIALVAVPVRPPKL